METKANISIHWNPCHNSNTNEYRK